MLNLMISSSMSLAAWPVTPVAGAVAPVSVTLSYLAVQKLKAFCLWINYRSLWGQDFPPASFDANTITKLLGRVGKLQQLIESDKAESPVTPPPFTCFSKWPKREEVFLTYLAHSRAAAHTRLSYFVRQHTDVAAELLTKEYPSLDKDLIDTILLSGEMYRIDNKQVYAMLKPLMVDGPGWPFIQGQNCTQNGREAFLRLRQQAEGQCAVTTHKAKAFA